MSFLCKMNGGSSSITGSSHKVSSTTLFFLLSECCDSYPFFSLQNILIYLLSVERSEEKHAMKKDVSIQKHSTLFLCCRFFTNCRHPTNQFIFPPSLLFALSTTLGQNFLFFLFYTFLNSSINPFSYKDKKMGI